MSRQEFNYTLRSLTDFPDVRTIGQITRLAQGTSSADTVADILQRFSEVSTQAPSHRVPLLYAIDAILRSSKTVYGAAFDPYIADVFKAAFLGSSELDKERLHWLLYTWFDRDVFQEHTLRAMKQVCVSWEQDKKKRSFSMFASDHQHQQVLYLERVRIDRLGNK